jgi:RHH-type proline utilization regulon transcriptional repressor/proline dehydrogenase/delta 1-pyrroline-5-carboxylate dehydrogenase
MRLLLVEDDPMIGAAAQQGLRQEGHTVDWVRDGREAEVALIERVHDVVLLDLGLPRRDGLSLLREWRARGNDVPVVILTARDAVADRIAGLDAGADDYLVKPFDLDELAARVRAVVRRRAGRSESVLRVGELEIDSAAKRVRWKGEELDKVIDAINATGYGLTLGVHSRIDETIDRIAARVKVGNVYVNRNQIGAVVGVQPFGGQSLSGTGPKAGGPHYLPRFATEKTVTINTTAAGGNASLLTLGE